MALDLREILALPQLAETADRHIELFLATFPLRIRHARWHEGEVQIAVDAARASSQGYAIDLCREARAVVERALKCCQIGESHRLWRMHALEHPEVSGVRRVVPGDREQRRGGDHEVVRV